MNFENMFKQGRRDFSQMLWDIVAKCDSCLESSPIESNHSGSTCLIILVINNMLYVSNTGDSKAIEILMNSGVVSSKSLNLEHKCELESEQQWIISRGGRIDYKQKSKSQSRYSCKGPLRVWFQYEESPGLAMTRSVGDHAARSIGIICDPDVYEKQISD